MSILGTRVLRIEDPKFLTTGGVYTDDLRDPRLDGAGYVTYVRSVVAHARVTVDVSEALEQAGVIAVVTGEAFASWPSWGGPHELRRASSTSASKTAAPRQNVAQRATPRR